MNSFCRRLATLFACFFSLIRDLFFQLLPFLAGAFFLFFAVVRGEFLSVVFEVARVIFSVRSHRSSFEPFRAH